MEYIAVAKNVDISPRKVRLVADAVKKLPLEKALFALAGIRKRAAVPIRKTIESAVANALHHPGVKKENLILKAILVQEGVKYKRYHFAARGRIRPYKRRTSHIKVILEDKKDGTKS
jgi:large subunit ribosomal protein L22